MSNHDKKIIRNDKTGDSYVYVKHPTGLDIYIWKKEGFTSTEALFGTKYGSVNNRFSVNGGDVIDVPEGIAHFLEHKLFENEDCDVFELYAQTGAMGNAYTSFDQTVYQFSCTENYAQSLRILLSFVQKPYFTQETVDKEQGIIGQEIKMCEDDPDRQSFFKLLKCLYVNHPVKIDIAGTVDSIAKIDADLLYKCYNAFYNLSNMTLAIAGDLDVDEVLRICDEELVQSEPVQLCTQMPDEPDEVACGECTVKMPVGMTIFSIGYKCKSVSGEELLRKSLVAGIALKLIVGDTSPLYDELIRDGLINSDFGFEVFFGDGYFCNIFSGESKNTAEVKRRIEQEALRMFNEGVDCERFEIIRRANYGSYIRTMDKVDVCADIMLNASFNGCGVFDSVKILSEITCEEIRQSLPELINPERSAVSLIEPVNAVNID